MNKFIASLLSLTVLGAIGLDGYWLLGRSRTAQPRSATNPAAATSSAATSTTSSARTSGTYKNGTYTGKATATQWGDVQVQAVIKNGKITTLTVLKFPDQNGHDKQINARALPTYKAEALTKQSAKIQLVSGASETYKGFTGSLQNALDQAEV